MESFLQQWGEETDAHKDGCPLMSPTLADNITSMLQDTGKKDNLLLISRIDGGVWIPEELVAFTEQKGPVFQKGPTWDQHSYLHGPEQSHFIAPDFLYYITSLVGMLVKFTSSS